MKSASVSAGSSL